MSDGPHRSLPMKPAWKELAKRADQRTYDLNQVREAMPHALHVDFQNEVSGALLAALKQIFAGNTLGFQDMALAQLEQARPLAAGSVFGNSLVAWAEQLICERSGGLEAFYEAVGKAAQERFYGTCRQIEEHYLRESHARRADGVRTRLEEAMSGTDPRELGKVLSDPRSPTNAAPKKRTAIEDGVPM